MKITFIGDTHKKFYHIKEVLDMNNDLIISTGDFGYWPGDININHALYFMTKQEKKLYFCDGNHENHWAINELCSNDIVKNVIYMKRGKVLTINDSNILFMGGASSIDRKVRTVGLDWFPEEVISQKDMYNLPNEKIDIVVSHTCPNEFFLNLHIKYHYADNDPSRKALSYVLDRYRPKLWIFGHFHVYQEGNFNSTKWICLNKANKNGWHKTIEI
jgi:Icc-related predicted phosphoesterase